jgi:hypothetical protein
MSKLLRSVTLWATPNTGYHFVYWTGNTGTVTNPNSAVERWFCDLSEKKARRESSDRAPDLITAIDEYMAVANSDPRPFVWHKSVHATLDRLARCKAVY